MRDYKLTLNLVTNEAPGSKIFKQYDTGNEIELELYQNEHLNADEKLVLTDESVLAFFKRQDGQVLQKNCTVRNGNVIVTTSKDVLGVPGILELECLVKKGDVETTTTRMTFTVQESIARDGAIEEDPRYTSDLVTELLDVRDNVKAETIGKIEEVASQLEHNVNKTFKQTVGNYRNRKAIMTIFDDDGNVGAYTRLFRLAKELGIVCVEAVPTGKVGIGQQATLEQLTEMKNAGWDIVSHTHNHVNLSLCTEEEKHSEMKLSKDWLQKYGFTDDVLVYPLGEANSDVRRIARNYYKCAVQIDNVTMVNVPPIRTYAIERVSMKRNTIEQIKAKIDETVAKNGWLAIMCHAYMESNIWTDDQFRDLINYAKSKLEIVNVTEALGIIGNTLDIGDTTPLASDMNASVIDCDGNIFGQTLGKVRYIVNGVGSYGQAIEKVTNSTLPSFFEGGKTTIINISMDDAVTAGFPQGRLGTLITHKFSTSSNRYCFQEFWLDEFTKKYRRCWLSYNNSWSNWVKDELIEIPTAGTYSATSIPNTFKGQFTIQSITSNTSGFPTLNGGTLITSSNSSDFAFQFFKELYTGRMWTRSFKNKAWTNWELLSNSHSKALNSVNMTTPITDFEQGITITYFTDTSASGIQGLPENKGGIMTTYRQGAGSGFSYQEYKVKNSFNKYLRYLDDDGTWSVWKQFAYIV